jgi:hypothetical protein
VPALVLGHQGVPGVPDVTSRYDRADTPGPGVVVHDTDDRGDRPRDKAKAVTDHPC